MQVAIIDNDIAIKPLHVLLANDHHCMIIKQVLPVGGKYDKVSIGFAIAIVIITVKNIIAINIALTILSSMLPSG